MNESRLDRVKSARSQQSAAAVELWNARLGLLQSHGDTASMLAHIASPVEEAGNNCECNNGCNVPCGSACGVLAQRESVSDPPF
jgi:hypothetical protein